MKRGGATGAFGMNRRMSELAVLILAFGFLGASVSDASEILTMDHVIRSVQKYYPVLRAQQYERESASRELDAARGGFDPVVRSSAYTHPRAQYDYWHWDNEIEQPTGLWGARVFAGYRKSDGNIPVYDGQLVTDPRGEARIGMALPLLRGGSTDERRTRIAVASQELGVQTAQTELDQVESIKSARFYYIEWVTAGHKMRVSRDLLRLAEERDRLVRKRVARGDAAEIESVDNARAVAQREALLVASRRNFEAASLDLSLFLRDEQGAPMVPQESQIPAEGLRSEITFESSPSPLLDAPPLNDHPLARRWDSLIGRKTNELSLAKNLVLPRLDLEALGTRDLGPPPTARTGDEIRLSLKLEFPLFFRAPTGRLQAAELERSRLKELRRFALERIRNGVTDADQAVRAARERIAIAKNEWRLSLRVEEAERKRFASGDSTVFLVNQREQATFDSAVREIDARADLNRAFAFLIASRGKIHETDVTALSEGTGL